MLSDLLFSTRRLVPALLAGAVLSLAAPAAGVAKAHSRHFANPIAHVIMQTDLLSAHPRKAPKRHRHRRRAHRHPPAARVTAPIVPVNCDNADTPAAMASADAMRTAIICLANQQRVARGLPTLEGDPRLHRSAQGWTDTMVSTGQFWHGTDFPQRISAVGYAYWYAGENIATGYATPRGVMTAWMASPGHCRNILNPFYAEIGVGLNLKPVGTSVADAATWTQDFGLAMGHGLPSKNSGPMNSCGPPE